MYQRLDVLIPAKYESNSYILICHRKHNKIVRVRETSISANADGPHTVIHVIKIGR